MKVEDEQAHDLSGWRVLIHMGTRQTKQTSGTDVLHGAVRGVVAAMSMSGMRTLSTTLELLQETPPEMMVGERGPNLLNRLPESRYQAFIVGLHWAYGGAGGAVFGALPSRWRRLRWAGPVYGTVMWLGFEMMLEPVMGIRLRRTHSFGERAALAADHLLYGLVLSEMRRRPAK